MKKRNIWIKRYRTLFLSNAVIGHNLHYFWKNRFSKDIFCRTSVVEKLVTWDKSVVKLKKKKKKKKKSKLKIFKPIKFFRIFVTLHKCILQTSLIVLGSSKKLLFMCYIIFFLLESSSSEYSSSEFSSLEYSSSEFFFIWFFSRISGEISTASLIQ